MPEWNNIPSRADVARVVDAMEAYARLVQMLRFSPLAQGALWGDLTLTLPQVRALGSIACAGQAGRSGRELAAHLGVGPSAVTPLVDRLVEHGYASRHEDALDRRILRVRATPAGQALLERLANVHRELLAEIVARVAPADLPLVERSLAILSDAVRRLVAEQAERAVPAPSGRSA